MLSCHLFMNEHPWKLHDGGCMVESGIAHRLKDNSAFLCLAKMLVALIRTTVSAGALWVDWNGCRGGRGLVGGVFAMNEPDEWTKPSIWRLFSKLEQHLDCLKRQLQGIFGNFTGIEKVFKVGTLSFICFVKISLNCVLLYLSNESRAKIMIYDRSDW